MVAVATPAALALTAPAAHGALVVHLLLLGRELGVEGLHRIAALLHLRLALGRALLHAVDARTGIERGLRPGTRLVVHPRSGNDLAQRPAQHTAKDAR